jgi:hypothetical protein
MACLLAVSWNGDQSSVEMALDPQEVMRIEAACRRLQTAFAIYVDTRQYERVVELFTDDAEYNPRGILHRGKEGVRRYLEARPHNRIARHVITNQMVDVVDHRTATGICFMVYYAYEGAMDEPVPLAGPSLVGDYYDDYALTEAGWRISRRIGRIVFDASR